jgi:hypothetical protein
MAAKAAGFAGFLDVVDGEVRCGTFLMLGDEARRGDEHAAGTARGVEDAPAIGFDDFGEEADDGGGVKKSATAIRTRCSRIWFVKRSNAELSTRLRTTRMVREVEDGRRFVVVRQNGAESWRSARFSGVIRGIFA